MSVSTELTLPPANVHTAARLLQHLRIHGASLTTDLAMAPEHLCNVLWYGCHKSAIRDTNFFRKELAAQTSMVHVVVLPWADVQQIPGIWITPLGIICQEVRHP